MTAPTAVLGALAAMLPRLQAEEAIAEVNVLRFAGGNLDERTARQLRDRWERAAGETAPTKRSPDDLMLQAQALGIEVVKEPAP